MQFSIDNKIIQNPLNYLYEHSTFNIPKKSWEGYRARTFNMLINCNLVRTPAIKGYKLKFDYIHLLEQEQFDEN